VVPEPEAPEPVVRGQHQAADLRLDHPFDAYCWHTVDPETILFTGNLNRNVGCSGSWLAHHEYVVDEVNKRSFLAHSGRIAGATSIDTHGDPTRSARHTDRTRLTALGTNCASRSWSTASTVSGGVPAVLRPAMVHRSRGERAVHAVSLDRCRPEAHHRHPGHSRRAFRGHGPGAVVFDENGQPESTSAAAERWISELVEDPAPDHPSESKIVQGDPVGAAINHGPLVVREKHRCPRHLNRAREGHGHTQRRAKSQQALLSGHAAACWAKCSAAGATPYLGGRTRSLIDTRDRLI